MEPEYISPYCFIVYRQGSKVATQKCFSEEERLQFMLELLFDTTHPLRKYKTTVYQPDNYFKTNDDSDF